MVKFPNCLLLFNSNQGKIKPVADHIFFFLRKASKCSLSVENANLWTDFWNSCGFLYWT